MIICLQLYLHHEFVCARVRTSCELLANSLWGLAQVLPGASLRAHCPLQAKMHTTQIVLDIVCVYVYASKLGMYLRDVGVLMLSIIKTVYRSSFL